MAVQLIFYPGPVIFENYLGSEQLLNWLAIASVIGLLMLYGKTFLSFLLMKLYDVLLRTGK